MRRLVWLAMMAVWAAAWLGGLWWIWPHLAAGQLTSELLMGLAWLVAVGAAWLLALNLGVTRYWRH
jgi:hypothetical protein